MGHSLGPSPITFKQQCSIGTDTKQSYVNLLAQFPNLSGLHLSPSFQLGLGYGGGPGCGNVFLQPEGSAYRRSLFREDAKATEKAGEIVLERLPDLKKLSVGSYCANITRNEDDGGRVNATWPWTGRLKEWSYEVWPLRGEVAEREVAKEDEEEVVEKDVEDAEGLEGTEDGF